MLFSGQNNVTEVTATFHSNVLAAGETRAGVCFSYRIWKGLCSSFYTRYCKNLPPPVANASACPRLESPSPPFASTCPASSFQPGPSALQRLSPPGDSPLTASPSARPVAPLPRYLPPRRRALCSQRLSAVRGEALPSAGSGLADAQHRHDRQIIHQSSTYEQWSSRGSLAGQVSTGTDKTSPCHLNSFPAKTSKMIS